MRVIFIEDAALNSASASSDESDGVSRFAQVFRDLGAEVSSAPLDAPLPDAEVLVLVRPTRALTAAHLARIWVAVENGANVLLALEPGGQAGVQSEPTDRGIARLLELDYGVRLRDGFLIAPTFTHESILDPARSLIMVAPEAAHQILAPLEQFGIGVATWGARSLRTEAVGIDSAALPLLYTEDAYGESDRNAFRAEDPAPLQPDITGDALGRLHVAAIGENARTQTRIALLTDGDMLTNNLGFALDRQDKARYIGNVIFAGRLAAWLINLPEELYPPLPADYAYVRIDGDAADWDASVTPQADRGSDITNARYNLRSVRTFATSQTLYMLVATSAPPDPASALDLLFDGDDDGTPETALTVEDGRFFLQSGETVGIVAEGRIGFGEWIELRLPLEFAGTLFRLCLRAPAGATSEPSDCTDDPIRAQRVTLGDLPVE
jgi:hypothetical protein